MPRIRSNSSSVSAWPQNDNPLPIVTGIAWGSLLASLHAHAIEIFRKSSAKSLPARDQLHCANGQSPDTSLSTCIVYAMPLPGTLVVASKKFNCRRSPALSHRRTVFLWICKSRAIAFCEYPSPCSFPTFSYSSTRRCRCSNCTRCCCASGGLLSAALTGSRTFSPRATQSFSFRVWRDPQPFQHCQTLNGG